MEEAKEATPKEEAGGFSQAQPAGSPPRPSSQHHQMLRTLQQQTLPSTDCVFPSYLGLAVGEGLLERRKKAVCFWEVKLW